MEITYNELTNPFSGIQQLTMLYFYELPPNFDWKQAHQQLCLAYNLKVQEYQISLYNSQILQNNLQIIKQEIDELKNQRTNSRHLQRSESQSFNQELIINDKNQEQGEREKQEIIEREQQSNKKIEQLRQSGCFPCTFKDCDKTYKSTVAMNLHIRMKHNGGNKKERQNYAKMIIEARRKGEEPPKLNINLPPKFLEEFQHILQYNKQYKM